MVRGLWIGSVILVGALIGLRRGWRRQVADAGGGAAALALAGWQYPRLVPYVRALWPALDRTLGTGAAVRPVALLYLFAVLYGLLHALVSLYVPDNQGARSRRWTAGLLGAGQAGVLATLALTLR
jgi:uncharacterized membrane protein required for colicin V production